MEELLIMINDHGEFEVYDDTYDVVIHCKDEQEHKNAIEILNKSNTKNVEIWNGQASCPCCKKLFGNVSDIKKIGSWEMPYCKWCGQKLDWSGGVEQ